MSQEIVIPGYYLDRYTNKYIRVLFLSSHFEYGSKIVEFVTKDGKNLHMSQDVFNSCLPGTDKDRFVYTEEDPWK